eukprot:Phypoly_transcript_00314.p1 GENE.Phypoly_transcript_00314~~Phypoly_transcript_00314.p1  ORF type:complete len:1738 (-),score=158.13 Phypoly_transcript_00314:23-5236(-)
MDGFLDYIEKQNSHIEGIIVQLERNDPGLTSLDLSKEEIRGDATHERLLESLKRNTNLTWLDLSGNVLKLSHNQLVDVFTRNLSLIHLVLHKKENAEAAKIIYTLIQLNVGIKQTLTQTATPSEVSLSVKSRKLFVLPQYLFTSINSPLITSLDVSHNRLEELPKEITKLPSLATLNVSHNRMGRLLPEIGLLTNLTSLNISHNRLVVLPSSIGLLANLKQLHINNNSLRQLPITCGNCAKLTQIHLNQNSFVSIPQEILLPLHHDPSQTDILLGYLHNLQKGSKRSYNMKMMFVGNGNVGKTMLMRALTEHIPPTLIQRMTGTVVNPSENITTPIPSNISTDGIDISDWTVNQALTQDLLPLEDDRLVFSCWDFAGQEVYYTTHQFFLSQRSLYLVIFDMRHPDEELSRLEYWMQSIRSRTSNSPVVLVGTHSASPVCTRQYIDKVMDDVEQRISRVKCADLIKTFAVVDSLQGNGIETLRAKLVSLALEQPYMGEEVPDNYAALQLKINAIKQTGKASLKTEEFNSIAVDCGIREEDVVGVTKYLHNLGVLVHFADEQLKNLVVINPQFLVDVMATIFTTKHAFVKNGILNHSDLTHIWREPRFPNALHNVLLSLLQRFEVCFSFPGNTSESGSSLFPSLLTKERPATDFVWPEDFNWLSGSGHIQHDRIFELDFFPSGLFSRLLVRLLQTATATKIWRYGVVLSKAAETALVELTHHNILRIAVRGGPNAPTVFRMLVEMFELLVSKWYNIKSLKRFIPCIHCLSDIECSRDPHYFSLEDCERSAALGSSSVICPKANLPIRLDQLVPDVVMSDLESRKIDFSQVKIEKELAKGGYGIVFKGEYNNQAVAVKQLILDEEASDMERNSKAFGVFRSEVWVMSGLRHPNIVQLLGFCVSPMAMVMEFVPSGTLYKYLASNRNDPLDWSMRLKCASDIARGMKFLHTLNPPLMHRDFKSPNIMMASTLPASPVVCKVADFGLSSQMWVESLKERDIANPTWLAPEVISETEYTVKSDVYSFGIILWELLTRQHPYQEFDCQFTSQLEQMIVEGTRPRMPVECIPEYRKLITDCWQPDPQARPTFATISTILDRLLAQFLTVPTSDDSGNKSTGSLVPPLTLAPNDPKKTDDATFAKVLHAPSPVWCLCVHNNRVWSAHGVEPSPVIQLDQPPFEIPSTPRLSSVSSQHLSPLASPVASPRISPRASAETSARVSSPATSPRNSPSNSPRAIPPVARTYSTSSSPPSPPSSLLAYSPLSRTSSPRASAPSSPGVSSSVSPRSSAPSPPGSLSPRNSAPTSPGASSPAPSRGTSPASPRSSAPRKLGKESSVPEFEVVVQKAQNYLGEICIWDAEGGDLVGKVPEAHPGIINSLLVVNDDVWSAAEDGSIKCWNIQSWESIQLKDDESEKGDFSGFLLKKATLNRFQQIWQKRWFVLKGITLTRYKIQNSLRPKEVMELKSAVSAPHKRKYCIALTLKWSSKGKAEGTTAFIAATSQDEHDAWLAKLQANTTSTAPVASSFLKPDLVGETFCGFGAVKCMQVVDGRVWAGCKGCICAWNIEEQRYTGVIKLNKASDNMKGGDLEEMFVTRIIPHNNYVWCAVGSLIIRVDPKTRQLLECIEGHTAPIDDMTLVSQSLWTCSAADHTLRFWDTSTPPGQQALRKLGTVFEGNDGISLGKVNGLLWFGGANGVIRIWDPETKTVTKTLEKKHYAAITSVALTNKTVWVGSMDNLISVWLLS